MSATSGSQPPPDTLEATLPQDGRAGIAVGAASTLASGGAAALAATRASDGGRVAVPAVVDELPTVPSSAYEWLGELARGGLGRILRARDVRTGRIVAIKEMLGVTDDAAVRFVREALVTANLQHPAIVPVYEVGRWPDGQSFYAMKLVKGRPLSDVIAETTDLDARLHLVSHVIAVADALAYAHSERVIHRDLKPANVLVGAHGETVVIDWGLARRVHEAETEPSLPSLGEAAPGETVVGAVLGTPSFMAPEQARGLPADERADVYAIGGLLYNVLSGRPPFIGTTLDEVLTKVRSQSPVPLARLVPGVPLDLAAIAERAMSRDPEHRYPSAAELATDLRRFANGQLVRAHRYTAMQRLRRFAGRYRAAVAVSTLAVLALATIGVISVRNVISARDVAAAERAGAATARDQAKGHLIGAYSDRARSELTVGRADRALALAVAAAREGGSHHGLRFIAARALEQLPALRRHDGTFTAALFAPSSHDLLLAGERGVERWSADRDAIAWHVDGDTGDLVLLDDGNFVAAGRADEVALLDTRSGTLVQSLRPHDGAKFIGFIGVDRERRWLAVPTSDGFLDVFEVGTRERVAQIPAPAVDRAPRISPDGQWFVVGSTKDGAPRLDLVSRDGTTRRLCEQCTMAAVYARGVAFTTRQYDGRGARIQIVDWAGAPILALAPATADDIHHIEIDEAMGLVVTGSEHGGLEVYELATGAVRWRTNLGDRVYEAKLDRSGRLWTLANYGGVWVHDAATGVTLAHWLGAGLWHEVAPDQRAVAVLTRDFAVRQWSFDRLPITVVAAGAARVRRIVFDGQGVLAASEDGQVLSVGLDGSRQILTRHAARATSVERLSDGALLTSGRDGTTKILDGATQAVQYELPATGPHASASPDGTLIAAGGDAGVVGIYERATGQRRQSLTALGPLMRIRWAPDGQHLAAIDDRGQVRVWTRDGALVRTLEPTMQGVDVVFSRDSRRFVRAARGIPTLYAVDPSQPDLVVGTTERDVYGVTVSADGARVAFVGSGFAMVFDARTGQPLADAPIKTMLVAAQLSRDGTLLFTGGTDRTVHVLDADTGHEYYTYPAPSDVYGLDLSADGTWLAVATLSAGFLMRVAVDTGPVAALQPEVACRAELQLVDGQLQPARVTAQACNQRLP